MRFPSCLLLLCLPAAICAAQNSPRWRFVHPHARVIAGLEWRRALDSPLGRELRREFEKSEFASLEGLDIMTGLEGVLISSPGQNPVRPGDDAPVVIAAEGGFDLNRVRKSVLGSDIAKRTYHGVEMYAPKREGGQRMTLGLVNERVLLFGDVKCLEAAIDRDAALPGTSLERRAAELAAANELWIVTDGMPSQVAGGRTPQIPMLEEITGIDAGLAVREGLGLQLNATARSADAARALANSLGMMLHLSAAQYKNQPEVADLVRKLHIGADGALVRVALAIDRAEIERGMASLRAHRPALSVRAVMRGDTPAETAAVLPPEEEKRTIFVHGLEGGTREIPYGGR